MRTTLWFRLLPAAALGTLLACGGDKTTGPQITRAADHLIFVVAPSDTGRSGAPLVRQPAVQVVDVTGTAFAASGVAVTVTADGGTLSGASAVTDATGRAVFTTLGVSGLAAARTLSFSAPGLPALSRPVAVIGGAAASLTVSAGEGQTATVGAAVPVAPAVLVKDAAGNPSVGTAVTFTAATGGGTVAAGTGLTGSDGIATVTSWTLGTTAGPNTLTAAVAGAATATVHATGLAGAPASLSVVRGDGQSASVGQVVPIDPAVQVKDQYGNVTTAATVQFTVTAGGGAVAPSGVDASGAQSARWSLGSLGLNTLSASIPGSAAPVSFSATGTPVVSQFSITLVYVNPLTPSQQAAFEAARARWSAVVVGDVPDMPVNVPAGQCFPTQPAVNQTVDDILIFVDVGPIDSVGNILGQAGPCALRPGGGLPIIGAMLFDEADLDQIETTGELPDVILHEMGHVLGIGTLWSARALVQGVGGADPFFTGPNGRQRFTAVGGNVAYAGSPVPVENMGGAGTAGVHWRETVMLNELMTGYISGVPNPLSVVTIGSLQDLGYVTDLSAADAYSLVGGARGAARAGAAPGREIVESPLPGPILVLDSRGRPVGQRTR